MIATSQYFSLGALVDISLPYSENVLTQRTTLNKGENPRIFWRTDNVSGNLRLEVFRRNTSVLVIHNSALNDGEWHSWQVPTSLNEGRGYRFKLTSRENPDVFGFSPWFRIQD